MPILLIVFCICPCGRKCVGAVAAASAKSGSIALGSQKLIGASELTET